MAGEVKLEGILDGRAGEGGAGHKSDGTSEESLSQSCFGCVGSSSAADAADDPSHLMDNKGGRGRYAQEQEDEHVSTGSGATEALSEMFVPVGQASKKHDSHHRHQFTAHEGAHRIAAGRDGEFRHCDIAGHEHSQCCACHKPEDHDLHHDGESCRDNRLHVVRTLSVKKAIRYTAPAGIVQGRQGVASSSSTVVGLQQADPESSDWATPSRHPCASYSGDNRNRSAKTSTDRHRRTPRRSRQKAKKLEPDSDRNYESPVLGEPSYPSSASTYPRGILRTSSKRGKKGLALDSTYSSQLPQTSLSSIARARSKETFAELRSYRRVSDLPYAAECSICQTKDNQLLAQVGDIVQSYNSIFPEMNLKSKLPSLDFQNRDQELKSVKQALDKQKAGVVLSADSIRKKSPGAEKNAFAAVRGIVVSHQIRSEPPNGLMSKSKLLDSQSVKAAAAGKKRESELVEYQLRRELHAAQEKLREVQQQDQQATDRTFGSLTADESQAGQNSGDLKAECDYLRKELKHMRKHLDILNRQNDSDRSVSSSEQPVDLSRLESAQKLVADLRSTLEESQRRLLQLEESHEKHEGDLKTKLMEIQVREAKLVKELQNTEPYDGQKELMRITNQLHMTTKQLESVQIENKSLNAKHEQCEVLQKQVETLNSELEKQKQLTQQWKEDSEYKQQNLFLKDQKLAEVEKELLSKEQATSELTKDLKVHRENLSSKDLILSTLVEEHHRSQESLQAKELRLTELEKTLQQAREELESRELVFSKLEKELQEHREHLSSKEVIATKLDKDLQQHRQSLLVKDQTIVEMERTLQLHRQTMIQTEEIAQKLQKDVEQREAQLREALEKKDGLERHVNNVAEKDRVHLSKVMTELDVTKEKLNDVLAQLEAKTVEENHYRRKSAQDLQEARAQTYAKTQEESRLRMKSLQDLQVSQEQLRVLQTQVGELTNLRLNSLHDLEESQEQLRVLQTQVEEQTNLRLNSLHDLEEAQEKLRSCRTQISAKTKVEENLRSKSAQDLQAAQEKLHALQAQLDSKTAEERNLKINSAQDLQAAQEKLHALQAQIDSKTEEERNLRIKSAQDLQEAQEQLKALKELQAQTNIKHHDEKKLRRKSVQELQVSQEQLRALQVKLDEKAEEEKTLRRKAEQDFQQAQEQLQSLQAEMKRELEKEQDLRRNSLMELQRTQEQLKEMIELKAQVEGKAEEALGLRRKSEQDLIEAQRQLQEMMEKDEAEKHSRRQSMQDLQVTQDKLRTMQQEHRRHSTATTERVNVLLAQQRDLVEQLETIRNEKKQLELDHRQVLLELEMVKKVFAGLKITLAKHDLCVDFVEDVEEVLKDLHIMIDDHKKIQHTRREEYVHPPDQEVSSSMFSLKRSSSAGREEYLHPPDQEVSSKFSLKRSSSAGKVLRDFHSMIDDVKKQRPSKGEDNTDQGFSKRRSKGEDYSEYTDLGSNSRISKRGSNAMGDTSLPRRTRSLLWRESTSVGTGTDFTDGSPDDTQKTDASAGEEFGDEEDPMNRSELKEELEERLETALSTLGVKRNTVKISDDMYEKLVLQRFQRRASSDDFMDDDEVMDTLNTFDEA